MTMVNEDRDRRRVPAIVSDTMRRAMSVRGVVIRRSIGEVEVTHDVGPRVGDLLSCLAKAASRRVAGTYSVDAWGLDSDLSEIGHLLGTTLLRVHIDSAESIPEHGPVVVVANRRFGFGELAALTVGLVEATGRRARFVGVPDISILGPALRRVGGVAAHPSELGALLRAGELVLVPLSRSLGAGRAGTVAPELLAPALSTLAPVVPAAVVGGDTSGRWRIAFGPPIDAPTGVRARTPLGAAELAERAHTGVQIILDDVFPARWSLG